MKNNINSVSKLSLIGKTKREIVEELGDGFNFYPDNIWSYELEKNWWGSKIILYLSFVDETVVKKLIKKVYGKVSCPSII